MAPAPGTQLALKKLLTSAHEGKEQVEEKEKKWEDNKGRGHFLTVLFSLVAADNALITLTEWMLL